MRPVCTPRVRRRLRKVFRARTATYIGRGFNNAHHRLSGITGSPDLVVRRVLFPVKGLTKRLDREYRVLEYLAKMGYPHAPQPVRRLAPEEIDGSPAYAMVFVNGVNRGFNSQIVNEMGKAVRRLHDLPYPEWLAQSGRTTEPLSILMMMWSNWYRKFETVRASIPEIYRKHLELAMSAIPERLRKLDWNHATKVFLHGDLGDHNFLWDDVDSKLYLLDWEFASVSDPVLDLMWLFNRRAFKAEYRKVFFDGYGWDYPATWLGQLKILQTMCIIEDAIWAQSGIIDIVEGRNLDYFKEGEFEYLQAEVERVMEIET